MSTSNNFVHPQYHNRPFDDRPIDKAPSAAKLPAPSGGGSDASPSPDTFACYETPRLLEELCAPTKAEIARRFAEWQCGPTPRIVAHCNCCGADYDEAEFASLRQRGIQHIPGCHDIALADCPCDAHTTISREI